MGRRARNAMTHFVIRPMESISDFKECVRLQETIWGPGFSETVPVAILKVSQRLGGVSAGAYDEAGELAGFVYGMTGLEDGRTVHWSDMLAVRPGLDSAGLGSRLKAYQRERLLGIGIDTVYWTFDPLESRNAHINFSKLGVIAREYAEDMYGDTTSPLHQGIGTDRLIALWLIGTDRVAGRVGGDHGPDPKADSDAVPVFEIRTDHAVPLPGDPDLEMEARALLVPIPTSIQAVKVRSADAAREWRRVTRAALSTYLGRGYEVHELYRRDGHSEYLLLYQGG